MEFRPDEGRELSDYEHAELVEYADSIHKRMCASQDRTVKKILRRKLAEINSRITKIEELQQTFSCLN